MGCLDSLDFIFTDYSSSEVLFLQRVKEQEQNHPTSRQFHLWVLLVSLPFKLFQKVLYLSLNSFWFHTFCRLTLDSCFLYSVHTILLWDAPWSTSSESSFSYVKHILSLSIQEASCIHIWYPCNRWYSTENFRMGGLRHRSACKYFPGYKKYSRSGSDFDI